MAHVMGTMVLGPPASCHCHPAKGLHLHHPPWHPSIGLLLAVHPVPRDPQLSPDSPRSSRREPRLQWRRPEDISSGCLGPAPTRAEELKWERWLVGHHASSTGLDPPGSAPRLPASISELSPRHGRKLVTLPQSSACCRVYLRACKPRLSSCAQQSQLAGCYKRWWWDPGKRGVPARTGEQFPREQPVPLPCPARCWSSPRQKGLQSSQPEVQADRQAGSVQDIGAA